MKKIILVTLLALNVAACAGAQTAFQYATTPVTVTPTMENDAEAAAKIAVAGLVAYRRLCLAKVIDPVTRTCRAVITTIQPYTRAIASNLPILRQSLKDNDQITAVTAYKALMVAVGSLKDERAKAGI